MLTADFDRLGLGAGDRLLDLGCGFGRHAFEAARLGAHVVAADLAIDELVATRDTFVAMAEQGELGGDVATVEVQADALSLPFADGAFDRIVASEVLEHIGDDRGAVTELARVLRPGGTMAVTVPSWLPERICWGLSPEYHAPLAAGGHVRIYNRRVLQQRLRTAGLRPTGSHRAHALHTPYWWLRCAVGPHDDDHPLVRPYRRLHEWDIVAAPALTRTAERMLDPMLGKSLVVYATRTETDGATGDP